MKIIILLASLLIIAGGAFAADIDGNWEGEVQGMGGETMKISYTFKADGANLTGTTTGMEGNDISIQDGKINGNDFSFSLDFGMGMPMKFNGIVKGDTVELRFEMPDMGGMGGGEMPEMPPTILKKSK